MGCNVNKDWSILGDCLEENIPFTKENDARMEDEGIVKEEIIPVHLQHTNKEVDGEGEFNIILGEQRH
jgi:hypothetical protein